MGEKCTALAFVKKTSYWRTRDESHAPGAVIRSCAELVKKLCRAH